jgi:hypothetical protein
MMSALTFRYGPGLVGKLEHWHYDTFRAHWEAKWRGTALATFILDSKGQPSQVEVSGGLFKRETEDEERVAR